MKETKRIFTEPECEVVILNVADVITTSDDWWLEEI